MKGRTTDLDIRNCCLTIIQQIEQKANLGPALPDDPVEILDDVTHKRAEFVEKLNMHLIERKSSTPC